MATEAERKAILAAFPKIVEIQQPKLKEGVIEVWARLWRESGYQNLEDVPNHDGCLQDPLVKHTNAAVKAALATAEQLEQDYGIGVDRDVLLAAAILHDADKIVLYERKDEGMQLSALGRRIPHGTYAGHVALDVGLPLEVANVLITHSRDSNWDDCTLEGFIVHQSERNILFAVRMALGLRRVPMPPIRTSP